MSDNAAPGRHDENASPLRHRPRSMRARARSMFAQWWWLFPFALLAVNYAMPVMRTPMSATFAIDDQQRTFLFAGIAINLLLAAGWVIWEAFKVSNQFVLVRNLRINTALSIAVAGLLLAYGVSEYWEIGLKWATIVPLVAAWVDAFVSADRSINNAAQKPLMHSVEPLEH